MKRRYKLILLTVLTIAFLIPGGTALAATPFGMTNQGFESGDYTGWNVNEGNTGNASVETFFDATLYDAQENEVYVSYSPEYGDYFALVRNGDQDEYTTVSQDFTISEGETIEASAFFVSKEDYGEPEFLDTGSVDIYQGETLIQRLFYGDTYTPSTPWTYVSWTAEAAGTYTLVASVVNVGDNSVSSYIGLDMPEDEPPIELTPTDATNIIGTTHTLTASVYPVQEGVQVWFVIGNPQAQTPYALTDAYGVATLEYTCSFVGTQTIYAFIDVDESGYWDEGEPKSSDVTKTWINPDISSLTQDTAFNIVGSEHTVVATLDPIMEDIEVLFTVMGANATSGSVDTDANGQATFTYYGANAGKDTIYAYIEVNDEAGYQPGEDIGEMINKYWIENFITGGASLKTPKMSFSGIVGDIGSGIVGQFQIVTQGKKGSTTTWYCYNDFSSLVFSSSAINGPQGPNATHNTATFTGTFTNGVEEKVITVTLQDLSEGSAKADTIALSGDLTLSKTTIANGNFQVHDISD